MLRAERPLGLWAIATLNASAYEKALSQPRIEQPAALPNLNLPSAPVFNVNAAVSASQAIETQTVASKVAPADPRRRIVSSDLPAPVSASFAPPILAPEHLSSPTIPETATANPLDILDSEGLCLPSSM